MEKEFYCLECDHKIPTELVRDEHGDYLDFDDACPHCGAPTAQEYIASDREDFHSDI